MEGNVKVSKMIESLSILMDAAIDRKRQATVPLSEEMVYVNAYLYINSERFGKRLTVVKEIPEDIMGYMVPRLILQPVIEKCHRPWHPDERLRHRHHQGPCRRTFPLSGDCQRRHSDGGGRNPYQTFPVPGL